VKYTVLSIAVLALAVGCGQQEEAPQEETSRTAQQEEATAQSGREIRRGDSREEPQPLPRRDEVDPEKKIPDIEGGAQEDGYGLTMVVDGSSPQAFQESLELIAMDTTSEQYRQLDSALRFLGTYDKNAWSGLPNLYQSLDGLTGEEIIERARELRDSRRRQ
jgi:hypothetical protein